MKQSWSNFKILSQHSPGGIEENHEISVRIARCWGQDLNPVPPKYEAGVLTARLRHSFPSGGMGKNFRGYAPEKKMFQIYICCYATSNIKKRTNSLLLL
jgi:hypothetical protein